MSEDVTRIYKLVDPRDNSVRYIGQTAGPLKTRLSQHMSVGGATGVKRWCCELSDHGLAPKIELIEVVPLSCSAEKERFYINSYRHMGYNLLNVGAGGEQSYVKSFVVPVSDVVVAMPRPLRGLFNHVASSKGISVSELLYHYGMIALADMISNGALRLSQAATWDLSRHPDGAFLVSHLQANTTDEIVYEPFYGDI